MMEGRAAAVSSRGPGHGPLKAGTRVRIPLPLLSDFGPGPFVYRFRTAPFHGAETGSTPVRAMVVQCSDACCAGLRPVTVALGASVPIHSTPRCPEGRKRGP